MEDKRKMYLILGLVALVIITAAFGQISMKTGMNKLGTIKFSEIIRPSNLFKVFTQGYVFLGVSLYALSLIIWLSLLSRMEVSFLYPLLSLGYIVTAIFGFILLRENLTVIRVTGILLIILGCFLIIKS